MPTPLLGQYLWCRDLAGLRVDTDQVVPGVTASILEPTSGAPVGGREDVAAGPGHHLGMDLAVAPVTGGVVDQRQRIGDLGEQPGRRVELVEVGVPVGPAVVADGGEEPPVVQGEALPPLRPGPPLVVRTGIDDRLHAHLVGPRLLQRDRLRGDVLGPGRAIGERLASVSDRGGPAGRVVGSVVGGPVWKGGVPSGPGRRTVSPAVGDDPAPAPSEQAATNSPRR